MMRDDGLTWWRMTRPPFFKRAIFARESCLQAATRLRSAEGGTSVAKRDSFLNLRIHQHTQHRKTLINLYQKKHNP
jgi:hypothetical protein